LRPAKVRGDGKDYQLASPRSRHSRTPSVDDRALLLPERSRATSSHPTLCHRLGLGVAKMASILLTLTCSACSPNGVEGVDPPPPRATVGNTQQSSPEVLRCTAESFRPLLESEIPKSADVGIQEIHIEACQNGYASLILTPSDASQADPLPVFLKQRVDGEWAILAFGPEVQCSGFRDLPTEVVAACEALGLR